MNENRISKKKIVYKIGKPLRKYLEEYDREMDLPLSYHDLARFVHAIPLKDKQNKDTLWETVYYSEGDMLEIYEALKFNEYKLMPHFFTNINNQISNTKIQISKDKIYYRSI